MIMNDIIIINNNNKPLGGGHGRDAFLSRSCNPPTRLVRVCLCRRGRLSVERRRWMAEGPGAGCFLGVVGRMGRVENA